MHGERPSSELDGCCEYSTCCFELGSWALLEVNG